MLVAEANFELLCLVGGWMMVSVAVVLAPRHVVVPEMYAPDPLTETVEGDLFDLGDQRLRPTVGHAHCRCPPHGAPRRVEADQPVRSFRYPVHPARARDVSHRRPRLPCRSQNRCRPSAGYAARVGGPTRHSVSGRPSHATGYSRLIGRTPRSGTAPWPHLEGASTSEVS